MSSQSLNTGLIQSSIGRLAVSRNENAGVTRLLRLCKVEADLRSCEKKKNARGIAIDLRKE